VARTWGILIALLFLVMSPGHGLSYVPPSAQIIEFMWSFTGKFARIMADKPVVPVFFADSLCERRDLVVRHPARPIPLYLNPCDGRHSSTAKAVAFCERGKSISGCNAVQHSPYSRSI